MQQAHKQTLAVAVPAPAELAPPAPSTPVDTLQDLIHRRAESSKNRLLYHLTETDCSIICTNATDLQYTAGQVIAAEGDVIQTVRRIKSGCISLMKGETKLYDLPQGYFIGEGLFIRGDAQDFFGATLVANGPVVLSEVNLPFVRQMLDVDKILAFKIYRHIASKLSALLFSIVTKLSNPVELTHSETSSTISEEALSSTDSEHDLDVVVPPPPKAVFMSNDMLSPKRMKKKKRITKKDKDVAFKTYQLYGCNAGGQVILHKRKLVISGCKFSKRKVKYNKILDMAKTGKGSVTIIYGFQARTIFFKDDSELNEFYNLVQSLIITGAGANAPALPSSPPASLLYSPLLKNPLAISASMDPATVAADKHAFIQMAVRQDLKKGDIVVAEGDLYQRIYTVASGQLNMNSNGRTVISIEEGEVFGVLTLFHLRPCNVTIEVASETATLLIIPHYKIQELISSNFPLAVRLHKKAAQLVYAQIERVLEGPKPEEGESDESLVRTRSRSASSVFLSRTSSSTQNLYFSVS